MLAMGTSAALALGAGPQATADVPAAQETTTTVEETTVAAEETTVAAQQTTAAAQQANVTFTNQTSNGSAVVVERVVVPEGGFVVIHEAQSAGGAEETATQTTAALDTTVAGTTTAVEQAGQQYTAGAVLGNSTYLEPGVHQNVTVQLDQPLEEGQVLIAMPHRDTNDNQQYDFPEADDPYTVDGQPVTDWANVTVEAGATTTAAGVQTTTVEDAETTTEEM